MLHLLRLLCVGERSPFFALVDVEHDITHLHGRLNAD